MDTSTISGLCDRIFDAADEDNFDEVKIFIEHAGVQPSIARNTTNGLWEETLAHIAARNGNLDMLKFVVEKDPSVLAERRHRLSVLEEAVEKGALDIIKYLVENHHANIYEENRRLRWRGNLTPVQMAVCRSPMNVTKYFVEERNVNVDGLSLLFDAIRCGRYDITMYLIDERKADLTIIDTKKENVLFKAVLGKDFGLSFMKYVLDEKKAKLNIDWTNNEGQTVLWTAVSHSSALQNLADVVQYLVGQKNADVNIPDNVEKQTPLHVAVYGCSDENVIKYLVDHGAHIAQTDIRGDTPLHLASSKWARNKGYVYLVEHGADVNQRNEKGETPLDIAISENNYEACKYFVQHGGDIGKKKDDGETLMHVAATRNQIPLLDYLVREKHANVNTARTSDHWTPLHCAAFRNNYESCEYLVRHGADPTAKGRCGKTPAQLASSEHVISVIQNTANTARVRRSVVGLNHLFSSPAILPNLTLDDAYALLEIAGNSAETHVDAIPVFFFQNFLSVAAWLVWKARPAQMGQQGLRSTATILQNRMDPVAEMAVDVLPKFLRKRNR